MIFFLPGTKINSVSKKPCFDKNSVEIVNIDVPPADVFSPTYLLL